MQVNEVVLESWLVGLRFIVWTSIQRGTPHRARDRERSAKFGKRSIGGELVAIAEGSNRHVISQLFRSIYISIYIYIYV